MSVMTAASERTHVRRHLGAWLAAVLVALTCAALAAAAGAWLGWRTAGPLPTDAQAQQIAATLAPGAPVVVDARHDAVFGYEQDRPMTWLLGDDSYNGGHVDVTLAGAEPTRVRGGLQAGGWRVEADPTLGVSARKGEVAALVSPGGDAVTVEFGRTRPAPVRPLELAGWVAGVLAGWFVARRLLAAPPIAWAAGVAGLVLLLPGTVLTTGQIFAETSLPATITPPALWGDYAGFGVHLLSLAGAALCLLAAFTAAWPRTGGVRHPGAVALTSSVGSG